jgi:chromosome segregation ATPase
MDGATLDRSTFQTPARILIPKLVASRAGWKGKAGDRKRRLKAARIRIRDLEASRQRWHDRADDAERKADGVCQQLAQAQQALVAAQAEADQLRDELKKN